MAASFREGMSIYILAKSNFFQLVVSTHLKNMLVKLDHFPKDWDEHKNMFETNT